VGKDYPEEGMHAPHLTDELYSVVMRKKYVLPERYRKFRSLSYPKVPFPDKTE